MLPCSIEAATGCAKGLDHLVPAAASRTDLYLTELGRLGPRGRRRVSKGGHRSFRRGAGI